MMLTGETPTVGLGRFIKDGRFIVPSHQRDYSWTREYVDEFVRDIEDALKQGREIYFCGLMVFTRGPTLPVLKVLDGQQRLATTLMIFSAIRNWFSNHGMHDLAHQVGDFLSSRDQIGSAKAEAKLSLTAANNDAFHVYVIAQKPTLELEKALGDHHCNDRSRTLLRAAIRVNRLVEERATACGTQEKSREYFLSLLNYLSDTVKIISFVLNSDEAAYTVFETLNDRGLELAPLDLVKNHLFSRAEKYRPNSLAEFEERWSEMMALLSSARADSFLRVFWASRFGKPEGAGLFSAFKKEYDDPTKLYQVSMDMRQGSERYAALFSSDDPMWSEYSHKAKRSIDALGIIGFSQIHPVILAAMDKFNLREMERLLWLIECVAVRWQLIAKKRPGRVESLGGRAAKEIYEGKIESASEVFATIQELYVSDEEFELAFSIATETTAKKVRYLISGVERQSLAKEGRIADELEPGNVTLEHIFPRSPDAVWAARIPKGDAVKVMNRLGNLCLLPPGINNALGNRPWADKTAVFARSRLNTTANLAQQADWGIKEIEARQKWMAQLARSQWRFQ